MHDLERRTLLSLVDASDNFFRQLGIAHLEHVAFLREGTEKLVGQLADTFHHAGTTRMSASKSGGVVDVNCRVHSIRDLFVCGGSVMPTSGFANPNLTIAALALRLAAHLNTVLN